MLSRLYIKDFAIVEELDIEFPAGFIVITGETGAGKSIIVGALGLLCGDRGQSELVRAEAAKAILEAEFYYQDNEALENLLTDNDIERSGNMLIIRREINNRGVSRAFINDTPVNITLLNQVTSLLIDLHGQHQHQRLVHPENHVTYLDDFGLLQPVAGSVKSAYHAFKNNEKQLEEDLSKRKQNTEKKELYNFQLSELTNANLVPEELETLVQERKILENNEALFETTNQAGIILYANEDSVSNHIAGVLQKLRTLVKIDPSFDELITGLESAQISIEEVGRQCETYAANLEFNPDRLEEIQKREAELLWLIKKYQVNGIDELIKYREDLKQQLSENEQFDENIRQLEKILEEQRLRLQESALQLSQKRKTVSKNFEYKLEEILDSVGLPGAKFNVKINWQENEQGLMRLNGKKYEISEQGLDRIEFHIGLNLGEPSRPLHKVASGGEISRIMLSIKTLLAAVDRIDTLIFDEIDSGISGRFAQIVGRKMLEIAGHHQLIVITHLPQIAAQGQAHLVVSKQEADGRTKVKVMKLNDEERVTDIARLLGGERITPEAMANARGLLRSTA